MDELALHGLAGFPMASKHQFDDCPDIGNTRGMPEFRPLDPHLPLLRPQASPLPRSPPSLAQNPFPGPRGGHQVVLTQLPQQLQQNDTVST